MRAARAARYKYKVYMILPLNAIFVNNSKRIKLKISPYFPKKFIFARRKTSYKHLSVEIRPEKLLRAEIVYKVVGRDVFTDVFTVQFFQSLRGLVAPESLFVLAEHQKGFVICDVYVFVFAPENVQVVSQTLESISVKAIRKNVEVEAEDTLF